MRLAALGPQQFELVDAEGEFYQLVEDLDFTQLLIDEQPHCSYARLRSVFGKEVALPMDKVFEIRMEEVRGVGTMSHLDTRFLGRNAEAVLSCSLSVDAAEPHESGIKRWRRLRERFSIHDGAWRMRP